MTSLLFREDMLEIFTRGYGTHTNTVQFLVPSPPRNAADHSAAAATIYFYTCLADDHLTQVETEKLVFLQEILQNQVGYYRGVVAPKTTTSGHVERLDVQQYADLHLENVVGEYMSQCKEADHQPDKQNIYLLWPKAASTDLDVLGRALIY